MTLEMLGRRADLDWIALRAAVGVAGGDLESLHS